MKDDNRNKLQENPSSERRQNFRVTCPITVAISLRESSPGSWFDARVLDLSLGGVRIAMELNRETLKDLEGAECSLRFDIGGKERTLTGRFVGIYKEPLEKAEETTKKPFEAGIRFEGLSVDDQFVLVDLFGKRRTPLFL